jgi:O-antigen/teichoic acid export membrane protein
MRSGGSKLVLVGQVIAGLMSFLALAITANYVGAKTFGFCSICILVLNIAIALMDFGACSWASREYAAQSISLGTFKNIMWSKTKLNLFFALFIPVFFIEPLWEYRFGFLLLLYPALWNRSNYIQQFLLARNMLSESVLLVLVDRTCWLLIIPFSIMNLNEILAFALPIIVGLTLQSILFNRILGREKLAEGESLQFKQLALFGYSRHFGAISITSVISNFDGILVATFSSIVESSNFLLAQRFRNPLTIVFSSIAMRLRPIAARKNIKSIKTALVYDAKLMLVSVISTLGIAFFLLEYSEKFLGQEFKDSGVILFFGVIGSIPLGVLMLASSLLSSMGSEKFVAKVNSTYTILILPGVAFGTYLNGSLGAVAWVLIQSIFYASYVSGVVVQKLMPVRS